MSDAIYIRLKEILSIISNPTIFELGVNEAQDTIKILEISPDCIYYGFEPDPMHLETIRQLNLPIHLIESAVGNADGTINLYQSLVNNKFNTGSSSIQPPKNVLKEWPEIKFDSIVDVPICTLDTFCQENKISNIDFIWADIQGAELQMILGGQDILTRTSYLYTEYSNGELYEGQATLTQLLEALPGSWEIVEDYTSDVLFVNKGIVC